MKTQLPPGAHRVSVILRNSSLALLLIFGAGRSVSAAPVIWGPATTISGDTDALTVGSLVYAYDESNTGLTLNTVTFTSGSSSSSLGSGNITMSGFTAVNNTTFTGTAAPFTALSTDYQNLVKGAAYGGTGAAIVTLNNLASGHQYATQFWVNDSRSGGTATRTETITSSGGNTVTLDYNSTNAGGGVGQHTTGIFLASGTTTQSFTIKGDASSQMNAIQVRDVTNLGYWTGISGATWDAATTSNFASNLWNAALANATFDTAKAPLNSVTFADTYWNSGTTTAVTQNTVTVAAGGVSTGSIYFQNSGVSYTVTSSDANGISGSTAVNVLGGGTVTLAGTHSYTGGSFVGAGTLVASTPDALPGYNTGGKVSVSNGAQLRINAGGSGWNATNLTDLLSANGAGFVSGSILGIDTTGGSISTTAAITGSLALLKKGGNTLTLNSNNTYTGSTILDGGTLLYATDNTGVKALTFGAADLSTNVSTLDLNTTPSNLTATGLTVQTNSTGTNTINIGAGRTLTVSGLVDIGASNGTTKLKLTGATGTFAVNNGGGATNNNFYVGGGGTGTGTVDMSGLGTFTANLGTGTFEIGLGGLIGSSAYPYTVILAQTSTIKATKVSVGGAFADDTNASAYTMRLGSGTNTINTTDLYIGVYNNQGRGNTGTTLNFNTTTGVLVLRGTGGGSTRANVHIGENQGGSTGNASGGSFDLGGSTSTSLSGGNADLLIGGLTISRRTAGSDDTSSMTFRSGTMNVNTLVMGNSTGGNNATGTLTLNGGTVVFNTAVTLGLSGSTGAGSATMNVAGATVTSTPGIVMGNQTAGTVNSNVNITSGSLTLGGDISIIKSGSGTVTSTLTLSGGTLDMGAHNIGDATNPITFTINPATAATLRNVATINGTAGITKTGAGTLTLDGTNTYTGTTTISAGALQANDGTAALPANFISLNGGVLQGSGVASFTRSLAASGTSMFQFTANGGGFSANGGQLTVNIGGASAEQVWGTTVGTEIVGTLQFGSTTANARTLFENGIDLNGAVRTINVTAGTGGDSAEISGIIRTGSGTAGLTKTGAGTLVLSGSNSYTGATTVSAGTLALYGDGTSVTGSTSVTGTLLLGNSNAVTSSAVTLNTGSTLALRADADTVFNVASFNAGAATTINLSADRVSSGTGRTLTLSDGFSSTPSVSQTINYTGGNGYTLSLPQVNMRAFGGNVLTLTSNSGTLSIGNLRATYTGGTRSSVTMQGAGDMVLVLSAAAGAIGRDMIFNQTGTVTVLGSESSTGNAGSGTQFNSGTVILKSAVAAQWYVTDIGGASNPVIDNQSGGTLTFSKNTAATWNGNFTFGSASTTGALNLGTGAVTLTGNRTITTANATYGLTVGGAISGSNGITKSGVGTLALSSSNSFTGNVTVNEGNLRITKSGGLGTGTKTVTITGQPASNADPRLELDGSGGNIILASDISFNTSGADPALGVLRNLAGDNVINGTISLTSGNGGTRITSNGGTLTLAGNITAIATGRTLTLDGTSTGANTVSGIISNGSTTALPVIKEGAGTWILSGSNTYTGATTINAGTLQVGNGTDSGSIETTSAITNNGALVYNVGSGIRTLAAAISGTGTLTQNSAGGSLTLTATNTYTGLTSVNNGTLAFDVSETLTGGLNVATSGTAVLTAHNGGAANVKVLDITGLTISGTTAFVGAGGKDLGGLASPAPVPEPGTIALLAVGAIGGTLLHRRNRKSGAR